MTSMIIKSMRQMAWERAKGELRSMEATFWNTADTIQEMKQNDAQSEKFTKAIEEFIEKVEDNGLHE